MNIQKIKKSEEKKEDIHNVKNLNNLLVISKDIKKEYEKGIFEGKFDNIHVIGDIHGDFFTFKRCLELTQCVSFDDIIYTDYINLKNDYLDVNDGCEYHSPDKIKWNSEKKNSIIVFAGDIVDRCRTAGLKFNYCVDTIMDENCDYQMLNIIFKLDDEAKKYNSRVLLVLGNHEIINLQNDLRYVSYKGKRDKKRLKNINKLLSQNIYRLFSIIRINNYVIVHGGINPYYIKKLNFNKDQEIIIQYNDLIRKHLLSNGDSDIFNNPKNSFWDRSLGLETNIDPIICSELFEQNILNIPTQYFLNLKIIVAHCIQSLLSSPLGINIAHCDTYENRIIKIDVGMARTFNDYNYRNNNLLLEKLDKFIKLYNEKNILLDYNEFILNSKFNNIQILKLINNKEKEEDIIKDETTINYFFNTVFSHNKILGYYYLFQDLKKVLLNRIKIKFNIQTTDETINKIDFILSKLKSKIN
jgi:hypothetical protein